MQSVQRLVVVPDEPIGTIQPYLHGHFAEHLGELIYHGVWVGPESSIPNDRGIRLDIISALRPLGIPVLRWPGGCFADDYHWRDGIGPRESRPLRINRHWDQAPEPNAVGTHEFMHLCRLLDAEPYFAGNLGSGTAAELQQWVEYCNFDGHSTLAQERRENGDPAPFGVRWWGIGNENWACGGWMSPEQYAEEFARFRSFVPDYGGTKVEGIACGPNNADWEWSRRFLTQLRHHTMNRPRLLQGFAAHFYCGTAGTATEYTEQQFLELLSRGRAVEGVIAGTRQILDEFDPERRVKLILDEWGTWHPVEAGKPPRGLYQQNTMRDACVAGLSLDVFHRYSHQLYMANIAQLINVLQALLLVQEDRLILTPTYHAFALHRPHRGAVSVRVESLAESLSDGEGSAEWCRTRSLGRDPFRLRAADGSASVRDGRLCVTATNSHPTQPVELEVELCRANWGPVDVVRLAGDDFRAHNTFERPDAVTLSETERVFARGDRVRVLMPPASLIRLESSLA